MSLNDKARAALKRELARAFPERAANDPGHDRLAEALTKPTHTPELLEALKALRDLRNQWRNDDRFTSIDYMDAIDALPWEAAIAKAEGGAK